MIIRDTPLADRETVYIINNVRAYAWERSVAGREEGDEVRVHLSEEFVRGHAAQSGYFGVMVGDGEGNIVVRFQQQTVDGALTEGFLAEVGAETEEEAVGEELAQLLDTPTVAVPYPGLSGLQLMAQAEGIVYGTHTMEEERQVESLASGHFVAEDA